MVYDLYREADFHHRYGDNWKAVYEERYGPLAEEHNHIALAAISFVALAATETWLVKALAQSMGARPGRRRSKNSHLHASPIERVTRYKRNALLGIYFGVPGILLSVLLTLFRFDIFADHANEVVLAIFVFIGSYSAVIAGCYWWVKAKAWNDAVVFIGLMPLTIFLIPYVRLLVFSAPQIMMAAMVMMPLILIVVVTVLPDKSGINRRRAPWERRKH